MSPPELVLGAVIGLLAGAAILLGMILRPRYVLYGMAGAVLLLEHYPLPFPTFTVLPLFYDNLNTTMGIGPAKFNPMELVLAVMSFGFFLLVLSRPSEGWFIQTVSLLGIAYGGWMLFSVAWGVANGGNWKVGLWILRPVVYFLAISFLTFQMLRNPKQCMTLVLIFVICLTFKSMQIIWRHFQFSHQEFEAYGSHEDTSFALWAAWLAITAFFIKMPRWFTIMLWLCFPILLLAIVLNDRRINLATFLIGCMLVVALQSPAALMRRQRWLISGAAVGFLYLFVGWFGPTNPITAPVKGFKEGVRSELFGDNTDNSSWYRKVERFNLKHTIRSSPILGTGLGVRYLQIIPLDKLSFGYAVYIPHNQVTFVHSATGAIGYFIFLLFFAAVITQTTIYWRHLREPWQRATALVAMLSIMNWIIVGYYNMQLFYFRNSMFCGFAIAIPAALMRYQRLHESPSKTEVESSETASA